MNTLAMPMRSSRPFTATQTQANCSLEVQEHGLRTSWLAAQICEQLGLAPDSSKAVANAALTHDVGKQLLPAQLLGKTTLLTESERMQTQSHCAFGAWVLLRGGDSAQLRPAAVVALLHHEWWNGRGYPFGLARQAIPLPARIVAVADVFDALRSERPYKAPWPHQVALDYLRARRGIQFDPSCVDALLRVAHALPIDWRDADAVAAAGDGGGVARPHELESAA